MALPTVQITGKVLTPDGRAPRSGTVTCRLSHPGSALDGVVAHRIATEVVARTASDGAVDFVLVPNDVITPSGTWYLVMFSVSVGGRAISWTETWQVPGDQPQLDIGAVPRLDVVPGIAVATVQGLPAAAASVLAGFPAPREGLAPRWGSDARMVNEAFARPVTPPWEVLYRTEPVAIPATAGVFVNEIVDLAPFGVVVDQDNLQIDAVITKDGPNGTRITTINPYRDPRYEPQPPTRPAPDAPLRGVTAMAFALMDAAAIEAEVGGTYPAVLDVPPPPDDGAQYEIVGVWGVETGDHGPANRCRFVRLYAARTPEPWTPEHAALAATYKVHFVITGPRNVVKEWTYPIPAAQGAEIVNQVIDLRDYGVGSYEPDLCLTVEFRRNGKLIRQPGAWAPFAGETYDPPTYPVQFQMRGIVPGDEYEWEENNSNVFSVFSRYGEDRDSLRRDLSGDAWILQQFAMCTSSSRSLVRLRAWRQQDAFNLPEEGGSLFSSGDAATEYVPAPGEPAIPVPAGSADGCTLHVKLMRAGAVQRGLYPFRPDLSVPEPWTEKARVDDHEARLLKLETVPTYFEGALPGPMARPNPNDANGQLAFWVAEGSAGAPVLQIAINGEWKTVTLT
jgi:hypothetical protein